MGAFLEAWRRNQHRRIRETFDGDCDLRLPPLPRHVPRIKGAAIVVGDGTTLEEAVRRVEPGGRIVIRPGIHRVERAIETRKPFELLGSGAARTAIVFSGKKRGIELSGPSQWRIEGVALVGDADSRQKPDPFEVLFANEAAHLECVGCVLGGARGREAKSGAVTGGRGVLCLGGSRATLRECHLAFDVHGAAIFDDATLTLEASHAYGCDVGVAVGTKHVTIRDTRLLLCRYGLRLWGEGAAVDMKDSDVVESDWSGVFAAEGNLTLSGCSIRGSGGFGVMSFDGGEVVARGCRVTEGWSSGLSLGGRCRIESCEISRNAGHGIELSDTARGEVVNSRIESNDGFGLARDPKARVKLAGNRMKRNDRGGEHVYGTLATAMAKGFPSGVAMPEKLARLARFQEEHGRLFCDSIVLAPGPLTGWPGLEDRFAVFGTGPDGSSFAYWLTRGPSADRAPIVYLDSEGVHNFVIARTLEELMSIVARGHYGLRYPTVDDAIQEDDEAELETLREWLSDELGVSPAKDVERVLAAAKRENPGLEAIFEQYVPPHARRARPGRDEDGIALGTRRSRRRSPQTSS